MLAISALVRKKLARVLSLWLATLRMPEALPAPSLLVTSGLACEVLASRSSFPCHGHYFGGFHRVQCHP